MENNIPESLQELIEELEGLESQREKFSFLLELADELPPLETGQKTDENKLKGCASNAWVVIENRENKWYLCGEADAQISKGMLGFLSVALSGLTSEEIQNIPSSALDENPVFTALSPSRNNGFITALQRIRSLTSL